MTDGHHLGQQNQDELFGYNPFTAYIFIGWSFAGMDVGVGKVGRLGKEEYCKPIKREQSPFTSLFYNAILFKLLKI